MNDDDVIPIPDPASDHKADRALVGLTPHERAELTRLDAASDDDLSLDLAAALLDRALDPGPHPPLPPALALRIERSAAAHIQPGSDAPGSDPVRPSRRLALFAVAGWTAAAASLLWSFRLRSERLVPATTGSPSTDNAPDPLTSAPRVKLIATAHPLAQGAGGELAWDGKLQSGFLAIQGLAPVRADSGVYQLWIFDSSRDDRYPIDGGVFTLDDTASIRVPIRPAIPVRQPTLFAVTLEPPGGVVVSDRKRILLTAAWKG